MKLFNFRSVLALILATVSLAGCKLEQHILDILPSEPPEVLAPLPTLDLAPGNFATCGELDAWMTERQRIHDEEYAKYDVWSGGREWATAPLSSSTNVEVDGIDEADIVKDDADYVYVARSQSVEVVRKTDGLIVQRLEFVDARSINLLVYGGRLIVLNHTQDPSGEKIVRVVQFAKDGSGSLVQTRADETPGKVEAARLGGGILRLMNRSDYTFAARSRSGKFADVECARIQKPNYDDMSQVLMTFHEINLDADDAPRSSGRFGEFVRVFLTADHLYVFSGGYRWFHWDARAQDDHNYMNSIVAKYEVSSLGGDFAFQAAGQVPGASFREWVPYERAGRLHFVTYNWRYSAAYRIWTLSPQMNVLGGAELARGHYLGAVRFHGDRAFASTYIYDDPLEVFDLSGAGAPSLLGHLEVPGMSAYLHPVGKDHLLGIGSSTDFRRALFSLFDVSDSSHPRLIEQYAHGHNFAAAYPGVDKHAFYHNSTTQLAAVPMIPDVGQGALVFELNSGLTPVAEISHESWVPTSCRGQFNVLRFLEVGGELVAVSAFGISFHDSARGYAETRGMMFADAAGECSRLRSNSGGGWCGTQP